MKNVLTACAISAALFLNLFAMAGHAYAYELKKEKLAKVKTVAVVSVYGPEEFRAGFNGYPMQEALNLVEEQLVKSLKQNQLEVVPLDKIKALIDTEYEDAYVEFLRPDHVAYMRKHGMEMTKQTLRALTLRTILSASGSYSKIISSGNSTYPADYYDDNATHNDERHTASFYKALNKLMQKINAAPDAFMMVRVFPYTGKDIGRVIANVHVYLADTNGDMIFKDHISDVSHKEKLDMGFMGLGKAQPQQVSKILNQLMPGLLQMSFEHFNGRNVELDYAY